MFNGIIKYTGRIHNVKKTNNNCVLELSSSLKFTKNELGSSICCSGACLTLEKYNKKISKFYLSKETLSKTIFRLSKKGDIINLERPIKYGEPVSGHFVQGHVDTTAVINKINIIGKSWLITFQLDKKYKKYLVTKGSITINGVSLTIAKVMRNEFQISIIPKTLKLTNLIKLKKKDLVNVEFDVLAKYIKSFIK
tara:strand:- start:92 stop:676 length:585 start_codon:yes stop_codon:yes gene_type:complete